MLIKISGDGAKYDRSNTFLLMSFAFSRSYTTEDSSEVNSDTNYTAHQWDIHNGFKRYKNIYVMDI